MTTGIKFVKKANMWVTRKSFNQKDKPDQLYWFGTQEKALKKLEELNLQLSEIIGTMSKKEKKQYEKDGSSDEIVTFKIILDSDKDCDLDKVNEDFPDQHLETKEKKSYSWFFANIKEDDINSLITKIEEFSISEEDKEKARRLEE